MKDLAITEAASAAERLYQPHSSTNPACLLMKFRNQSLLLTLVSELCPGHLSENQKATNLIWQPPHTATKMEEVFKILVEFQDQLPENKSGKHSPMGCFQNPFSFYSRKFAFIYLPKQNPLCYKTRARYYLEIPSELDYLGTQSISLFSLFDEKTWICKPPCFEYSIKCSTLTSYLVHFFKYPTPKTNTVQCPKQTCLKGKL